MTNLNPPGSTPLIWTQYAMMHVGVSHKTLHTYYAFWHGDVAFWMIVGATVPMIGTSGFLTTGTCPSLADAKTACQRCDDYYAPHPSTRKASGK